MTPADDFPRPDPTASDPAGSDPAGTDGESTAAGASASQTPAETPAAEELDNSAPQAGGAEPEPDATAPVETEAEEEKFLPTEFHAPRRAPRYGRFAWAGALVGVLVAIALYVFSPNDSSYSASTIGIVLFMYCVPTGAALAVLLALFVDRKSLKNRSESSSLEQ